MAREVLILHLFRSGNKTQLDICLTWECVYAVFCALGMSSVKDKLLSCLDQHRILQRLQEQAQMEYFLPILQLTVLVLHLAQSVELLSGNTQLFF